jgi:hypothetical protein
LVYVKNECNPDAEEIKLKDCNCLKVKFNKKNKHYEGILLYRSPNGKQNIFLDEIKDVLNKRRTNENITCFFMGDINIDILNRKHSTVQKYLNILAEAGYLSLINKPTRIKSTQRGTSKTCLDHIFVGPTVHEGFKSFIYTSSTSDHFSTILKIESLNSTTQKKNKHENEHSEYTETRKTNYETLKEELKKESWNDIYKEEDTNICTTTFINTLKNYVQKHTDIKIKKVPKQLTPWITLGLSRTLCRGA